MQYFLRLKNLLVNYQFWKQIIWWIESTISFLWNIIFYNLINVFTVTSYQFNASLLNKSIDLFYFWTQTFER